MKNKLREPILTCIFRYHIPRSFLKPKNNLLVIFEETGGKPEKIEIQTVNRNIICSVITEYHPPLVKSWERKDNIFRAIVDPVKTGSHLSCPDNKVMNAIEFASFGDADGACGYFYHGKCNSPKALQVVEQVIDQTINTLFIILSSFV